MPATTKPPEEKVNNPFFARMYLRMASGRKAHGEDEYRQRMLAGLRGRVIELGAGNGLNFPLYPDTVDEVLAVEPEPLLREAAIENAGKAPVRVQVVDGVSGRLPAGDASFDAGVASLVLCSVPDQDRALAELFRVVRPGGELRFYEHVIAQRPLAKGLQRIADATFWPHVAGGCHMARDTGAAMERAGFVIETSERFSFSPGAPVPPVPHILGTARRP
jgi:ubiquinone/menaquinone biosynthesis C-methylase UbiE